MKVTVVLIHGISRERPPDWWEQFVPSFASDNELIRIVPVGWEPDDNVENQGLIGTLVDYMEDLLSFRHAQTRLGIAQAIVDAMTSDTDRVAIVSHSMGTVLAMSALHSIFHLLPELPMDLRLVDTFVTVGSPLWIISPTRLFLRRRIRRLLRRTLGWQKLISQRTALVRKWVNIAGLRDPVAGFGLSTVQGADRHCVTFSRHDILSYRRSWTYRKIWRDIVYGSSSLPRRVCCWL